MVRLASIFIVNLCLLLINQSFAKNGDNQKQYNEKYTGHFFDNMPVKSVQRAGKIKAVELGGKINQIAVPGVLAKVVVHPYVDNTFVECDAAAARMEFENFKGRLQVKQNQRKLYAQDHGLPLCTIYTALIGKLLSVSNGAHVKIVHATDLNYLEARDESAIIATVNTDEKFNVQTSQGSIILIDGIAKYQTAVVCDTSTYNALNLISDKVHITTTGLAQASVTAKKKIEGLANHMSSIRYVGPPPGKNAKVVCLFQGSCEHIGNPFN